MDIQVELARRKQKLTEETKKREAYRLFYIAPDTNHVVERLRAIKEEEDSVKKSKTIIYIEDELSFIKIS